MEINSKQISTAQVEPVQKHAQVNSGIKIKKIRFVGYEDVYNMEVKDHHNFAVEGGFIVHNCIDACRYSLSEDMIERKVRSMSKKALGL
ncbi:hypothetical protein [uncultured Anaerococcus sp.]|uniref:hypothetical protein n=1 Tax=uncultured Anaerococcus sp. TaxID=293428 RepID=UPI00260835EC|nr:hypothetical protein [uncultured Anaerococcus sp.]